MDSSKQRAAAARAAWLADLARAIDEAQQLAWRVGVVEGRSTEALELYMQLESARVEVEALRGGSRSAPISPWQAREADGAEPAEVE